MRPRQPAPEHRDLYACAGLIRLPLGSSREIVYSPRNGAAAEVPSADLEVLVGSGFRTLFEHGGRVANGTAARAREAERWLRRLTAQGILLSGREFLRRCQAADRASPPARIGTIALITRDRTRPLLRAVTSFLENDRRYGRTSEIVVLDDSPDARRRASHRAALGRIARQFQANVRYAGREEKVRFVGRLVRRGAAPPEVLDFALFDPERRGATYGANRNALLLDTAGALVLCADDDMLCQVARGEGERAAGDHIDLVSGPASLETWFFDNRRQWRDRVSLLETDLLARHEELLGRQVASCLASRGPRGVRIADADPHLLALAESGMARVLATQNGLLGDCSHRSPHWLVHLEGASRDRVVSTPSAWASARRSRQVMWCSLAATVAGRLHIGWAAGLDNREVLPPFFPVCRNEDYIFGVVLRRCFPHGCIGAIPYAQVHQPMERRRYRTGAFRDGFGRAGLAELVALSLETAPLRADPEPASRLRELGRGLLATAANPSPVFEQFVRLHSWGRAARSISHIEGLLERHGRQPRFWAADLERTVAQLRRALLRPDFATPVELAGVRSGARVAQRLIGRYGALLDRWPEIVAATHQLRQEGIRLSEPV